MPALSFEPVARQVAVLHIEADRARFPQREIAVLQDGHRGVRIAPKEILGAFVAFTGIDLDDVEIDARLKGYGGTREAFGEKLAL